MFAGGLRMLVGLCVCVGGMGVEVKGAGSLPWAPRVNLEGSECGVFLNWATRSCWHIRLKHNSPFSQGGQGSGGEVALWGGGGGKIHCEEERVSATLQSLALPGGEAEATAVYKDTYPQPHGCLVQCPSVPIVDA